MRPDLRPDLLFFPVGLLWLGLLLAFVLFVALVALTVGDLLGLPPVATVLVYAGIALGSAVNLPLQVVETRVRRTPPPPLPLLGWPGPPRVERRRTLVAVNVGGALVPAGLSLYLLAALPTPGRVAGLAATGAVIAVAYAAARPVPGTGIAVPTLVPPLASVGATGLTFGLLGGPVDGVARAAFAAGSLGTLVGADLLHLGKVPAIGAPVVSVGGAGTFDGIVLSGVASTLLAALLLGAG